MRKIIYGLLLSFAALSFVACDYNNPNDGKFGNDPQSGWVYFKNTSMSVVTGASTTFNVPILLDAPVNEDGLTVYFTVEGDGAGIVTHTGQATIEKGQLSGNIVFTIPAEGQASCSEMTVTLTSTSRSNVQVGFEGGSVEYPTVQTVTIGKGIEQFYGTWNVEEPDDSYEVTVSAGEAPNELVITNLFNVTDTSETHIFLNADSTVDNIFFPNFLENYLFTSNNPAQGDVYVSNDFFYQSESGPIPSFYDPCNMTMTLNYYLVLGPEQLDFLPTEGAINAVMTKQ